MVLCTTITYMTTFIFSPFKIIMVFWIFASKVTSLKFCLAAYIIYMYIAKKNFQQVAFILYPRCSVFRFQEAYDLLLGSMACISFTEPTKNKVLLGSLWDSMSLAFSEAFCSLDLNDCWLEFVSQTMLGLKFSSMNKVKTVRYKLY